MIRLGLPSLVAALLVSACSSVSPPAEPNQSPDVVASCLNVVVQGPATAIEGEGLTARLITKNVCDETIRFPVAVDTSLKDGEDTGVELSFHLDVTEPEIVTAEGSQGYLVRWSSSDARDDYDQAQKSVSLAPNGELVRTFTWNGRGEAGKVLESGNYVLFGTFWYSPVALDDVETTVDIQGLQPFKIVPN